MQNAQSNGRMLQQAPVGERERGKLWGNCLSLYPQLYSSSDQLWCWWTFFLLQSPHLQASLHPKTSHPKLRPVLCPVHLWHYCTTLPSHYPVRWNLKTLSDALQSRSFLAAFPGSICGFSTAFFLLFLPDTSPPCPKKKRLALHSCFPVFFLWCYLDISVWF